MKIHFGGKSLWVMPNSNGVKQRFLACFLKILDKKWRELLADRRNRSNSCQLSEILFLVKIKHNKERKMTF
jgi:hypothetical protein